MESIATVLYARLRNVLAICNGMAPERASALVGQLRSILEGPVAKQNGIVAMVRHDSILAVFSNDEETAPDHARRALHARSAGRLRDHGDEQAARIAPGYGGSAAARAAVGVHRGERRVGMGARAAPAGSSAPPARRSRSRAPWKSPLPTCAGGIVASGAARAHPARASNPAASARWVCPTRLHGVVDKHRAWPVAHLENASQVYQVFGL